MSISRVSVSSSSSYWCYRCNRFISVLTHPQDSSLICPNCNGGFVEEIDRTQLSGSTLPASAMYFNSNEQNPNPSSPTLRRARRNTGDRPPFNPVIILRAATNNGGTPETSTESATGGGFELYYDDGAGSGLRPLQTNMSEFLLGSGFDRLLDQLSQIDVNGLGRIDNNPPASKVAIESMPTVEIQDNHMSTDPHCAVCKEAFDLGTEAKEMPWKHLYHSDCILPWLVLRNSCPVCRHKLPTDNRESATETNRAQINDVNSTSNNHPANEEEAVGLTIWQLPGGGFAVGGFSSARRGGGRDFPVVFTEMDGGFNNSGTPRRISWASNGNATRECGRFRRVLHSLFSCFNGGGRAIASSSASTSGGSSWHIRAWELEENNGVLRR